MSRPKLRKAEREAVATIVEAAMPAVLPHLHAIERELFDNVLPPVAENLRLAVAWEVLDRLGGELWAEIDVHARGL